MEEDCDSINMEDSASTSEPNMEVCDNTLNTASTSEHKEDCVNDTASTSNTNREDCGNNMPSTSEKKEEEDGGNSTASTSEQKMDLGSGSDLEGCSKAGLNNNDKVKISIDVKTVEECVKMVKSKTKSSGFNKRCTLAGSGSSSELEHCSNCEAGLNWAKTVFPHVPVSDFLCEKCVSAKFNGVPSLPPPAPSSTQSTEGSVRYAVVPKKIFSVSASKRNEGSVNVIKPCRPNMDTVTVAGPSASMQNTAGSAKEPPKQNMGASVTPPSTTYKPNAEGTVIIPLPPNAKVSLHNIRASVTAPSTSNPNGKGAVKIPPLPANKASVLGRILKSARSFSMEHDYTNTNSGAPSPAPKNVMPSTPKQSTEGSMPSRSKQSAKGSGSVTMQRRCCLCIREFRYVNGQPQDKIRISELVDRKTAQVLLPSLSPEQFICLDRCAKWIHSKTLSTSDAPSPVPKNVMPSTPEQSAEGSTSGSVSAQRCCSLCKKEFKYVTAKKFQDKTRISKLVTRRTAEILLPGISPEEFICDDPCATWIRSKTTEARKGRKRNWTGFSIEKALLACKKKRMDNDCTKTNSVSTDGPSPEPSPAPKKVPAPPKKQAFVYLRRGHYALAFRKLMEIPAAFKALMKVCPEIIRKERVKLARDKEGPFRKQFTPEKVSSFSWKETNAWIEEKAPLTFKCLQSMFPQAQKITGQRIAQSVKEPPRSMTEEEAQQLLDKRIGMAMSIAQFTGSRALTFVQSLIGVEMFREGCSEKMFKIMSSLGLSTPNIRTAFQHAARLQDDHDKEVKLWKEQVEVKQNRRTPRGPAYSLTWDRVKIRSDAKNEYRTGITKPRIWAFRFAHRNRIPFSRLRGPPKKALEVSPNSILPSKQTYEALRQRMKTIVMRIIVDNLTALEGLRSKVVWHIPHLYSNQMKEKSNVVNLGAIPVDSKEDTEIMEDLIEYVPTLYGKPHKVLCCSDGLNINMTEDEPSESTAQPRFEGLVDAPPEYRKESLCYQDIMKMLFSHKSVEARGSLSQLKSVFAERGHCIDDQRKDTNKYVLDLDFITFVTSAYITLYAATECNLDSVDQKPSDFPTDTEAQMEWLSGLSHRLVDLVWMPPPQEDIDTAAAAASLSELKKKDCYFCGEEKAGEKSVQCCSNLCAGVWFHEGCVPLGTTDPTVTEDWFCSPECEGDGTYIYCHCKEQRGGQMVQCALMDQCRRHEWYHKDCLSLSEQANADSEESSWYCSEMCFIASDADDHVLNYTKALVWEGLYSMARRDAIKEGDGEAMTDFWKMDMVLFWDRKHLKDFTTCHRLLTGIEGFYPEHIRQDLKWNRVANLEGEPGCNISLDLVNEFMNIELKESLARAIDHYTNERMEICGKMAGALGYAPNRLLIALGAKNSSGLATSLPPTHVHKLRRQADIAEFVAEYKQDHLFRYIPGRAHQGFEKFTYQKKIQTPKKMGKTMRNLAQDMDVQS